MTITATTGLQLRSLVTPNGELEISLQQVDVADPGPDEVVIQVTATPINPSDLGLLFGMADVKTAKLSGTTEQPIVTAAIPEAARTPKPPKVHAKIRSHRRLRRAGGRARRIGLLWIGGCIAGCMPGRT